MVDEADNAEEDRLRKELQSENAFREGYTFSASNMVFLFRVLDTTRADLGNLKQTRRLEISAFAEQIQRLEAKLLDITTRAENDSKDYIEMLVQVTKERDSATFLRDEFSVQLAQVNESIRELQQDRDSIANELVGIRVARDEARTALGNEQQARRDAASEYMRQFQRVMEEREAFRSKLAEQCGETLTAYSVIGAARFVAEALAKDNRLRQKIEAFDGPEVPHLQGREAKEKGLGEVCPYPEGHEWRQAWMRGFYTVIAEV